MEKCDRSEGIELFRTLNEDQKVKVIKLLKAIIEGRGKENGKQGYSEDTKQ